MHQLRLSEGRPGLDLPDWRGRPHRGISLSTMTCTNPVFVDGVLGTSRWYFPAHPDLIQISQIQTSVDNQWVYLYENFNTEGHREVSTQDFILYPSSTQIALVTRSNSIN